jgi:divalent metal cation (Fe/Co/Zn/Cd) transporter
MLLTPTVGPTAARRLVLRRRVRLLVAATITYNVIEAVVAIIAGRAASSTALIGFGLDSIIEVSSAAAIVWQFSSPNHEQRERTALRVIAISFFALAAYVTVESLRTLLLGERAAHSPVGVILAAASLLIMPTLSFAQRRTGRELQSSSAVADSKQTLLCTYLSGALLIGLGANLLLGWWWTDPVVALFIAVLAIKEGREAWHGDTCCNPVAAISATRGSGPACDDACCQTTGRAASA